MDRSKIYSYSDGNRFANKTAKEVFTEINKLNIWQEEESVSGFGSALAQTKTIIKEIPKIIKELDIKTIFDIPCGDFNWFKEINLSHNIYLGGDIVEDIILKNNYKYKTENISFVQFNLLEDIQDKMDLVICRDCLVHFSIIDIWKAFSNIKKSKSRYLMTTTFTEEEKNYCTGKGNPPQHFAARFAAKEAFSKAIGTGWSGNVRWKDVEVTSDGKGKPNLRLHHEMHDHFASSVIHLSLSHTTDYVAAVVVIEQLEKQ